MRVLLFEDERTTRLYPLTVGRPAMTIACGGYRLIDLIERLGVVRAAVRQYLRPVLSADWPDLVAPWPKKGGQPLLLVNARLVPGVGMIERLRTWAAAGRPGIVYRDNAVVAALFPPGTAPPDALSSTAVAEWLAAVDIPEAAELDPPLLDWPLLDWPHDVVRYHLDVISENLADRLERGAYREVADGVFAAEGVKLGQYCVSEADDGPILLDHDVRVGPFCYLSGPAYLGPRSRVLEHAAIKDGVCLGHTTKVGGEVEASVIEPLSNKQHHGFLGHSYLGSWVNLGAGTCNSDLKNTYGTVAMEYEGHKVGTGMQFIGCIIGDYAKTAINTSIFTGKTIGACSMVYGYVTTNVPSFVNYARQFGQVTEAPVEVMIATQSRMFRRRGVEQRPCDVELLQTMHDLTRHERQLANQPLAL